jgi:uncharacterized repeat protein (TIGR01451 family)
MRRPQWQRLKICIAMFLLALFTFGSSSAFAAESGPHWTVTAVSAPTNFAPGDESDDDSYRILVTNTGSADSDGTPVTISDALPHGLTLDRAGAEGYEPRGKTERRERGVALSCVGLTCTFSGVVIPDETLVVTIPIDVELTEAATVTNVVRVAGGGAPDASVSTPTTIGSTPAGFGIAAGSTSTGLSSTQAGAHADLTTTIGFNTRDKEGKLAGSLPKEIVDELPPGFAGDLVDTPQCQVAVFERGECPIETQVGMQTLTFASPTQVVYTSAVYNLAPDPGDVAKLGFSAVAGAAYVQGDVTVRPGDYGLQTRFQNLNQSIVELDSVSLTVWGVPTAAVHNPWRWNGLPSTGGAFGASSTNPLVPYLSNPTSCTAEPVDATIAASSWSEPEREVSAQMGVGPFAGCDRLVLPATLTAEVTSDAAYSPTGLDVDTNVSQTYANAEGLATSALKREVVTLPEGMTVNPSSGAGLGACTEAEYAQEGVQYIAGQGCPPQSRLASVKIVTPALKEEITGSAFLAEPAPRGALEPGKNPFNSLLALYLIARAPARGVLIKAPGEVEPNLQTGRLVTTFGPTPEFGGIPASPGLAPLPASLITFSFNSGATAPLVTPPVCGSYTATAELTPYSNPEGAPLQPLIPPFSINQGVAGGPCPAGGGAGGIPFAPQIVAGTLDNDAGSYSPLDVRIIRNDGEQEITGFAQQFPLGLTANLTGVPFCTEAEIALARTKNGAEEEAEPACPAQSEIGHTIADAGVGPVLAQAPGKIYMAGPYEGAPFSAVAITSADVGPFDLGTVVVHLPLEINPETAQVSIPSGQADQIPHIIKGIVIHIRDIRVYIDRPGFALNPTNCDPQTFAATVIGGGADPTNPADNDPVTVTNPFQAADCQSLKFAPKFTVSTSGKTSKADGASLTAKLTYPAGSLGQDANIKQVKVELPKQLPSRLTTLQKACTAAQFNANPAGCPAASLIGTAKAVTPIIPVPLEGPAYFVSHGGEAFPDLEIVLQGYGVKIILTGNTFISKAGITSSTFKTVPDQPITSFELTLPEGPYSALAANENLCATTKTVTAKKHVTIKVHGRKKQVTRKVKQTEPASLQVPTEFVAQNGATINQSTPVSVTGCAAKAAKRAKRAKPKHMGGRKPKKK